jgi:multidrug resistance efflux pump
MNTKLMSLIRFSVTTLVVVIALVVAYQLWVHYKVEPWTRDGRVSANVVQIAPDVSGLVTEVRVKDNQVVNIGDILFVIDRVRYQVALDQAKAAVTSVQTQLIQAEREVQRNRSLKDLVSVEQSEQSLAKREQFSANLAQANSALAAAELNLARTQIKATVHGRVTNFGLLPGSYATAGRPIMVLIDLQSIYVMGYFEETKIDHIHVGDQVKIRLMGDHNTIFGHVDSIAGGIEDRELGTSANLLANVNPTFNWVRLAQRIPVRVILDKVSADTQLIIGRTATVEVLPRKAVIQKTTNQNTISQTFIEQKTVYKPAHKQGAS